MKESAKKFGMKMLAAPDGQEKKESERGTGKGTKKHERLGANCQPKGKKGGGDHSVLHYQVWLGVQSVLSKTTKSL